MGGRIMKEFNLEEAKAGMPVCTREGRPARIICWDVVTRTCNSPVLALVTNYDNEEETFYYREDGQFYESRKSEYDLMMASVKREGYVNIFSIGGQGRICCQVYESREIAVAEGKTDVDYIATTKVEWEE